MTRPTSPLAPSFLATLLAAVLPGPIAGQSTFDDLWSLADWYVDANNPVVQSLVFTGRFQYEYATVHDDPSSHDEWNVRRMRMGIRSLLFRRLTVHVEAELNPQERDPFYTRLTDAYLEWSRTPTLVVTLGKQGVAFTMDGSTSSKELLTIDRSNLANNLWFPQEYIPGASISGEAGEWLYHAGLYSSGTGDRELGSFDAGVFTLLTLGFDAAAAVGVERAVLRGSYVYQTEDPGNTYTRQLRHVGSLYLDLAGERWGLRADVSGGTGYLSQSDLWGAMLMPYLDVTPALQLVTRYTHLASADPNGVRLSRYESALGGGNGDRYRELYLGASYYLYGHELKLQGGVTLASMHDEAADGGAYSGVGATLGLRVSW